MYIPVGDIFTGDFYEFLGSPRDVLPQVCNVILITTGGKVKIPTTGYTVNKINMLCNSFALKVSNLLGHSVFVISSIFCGNYQSINLLIMFENVVKSPIFRSKNNWIFCFCLKSSRVSCFGSKSSLLRMLHTNVIHVIHSQF